MKTRRERIVRKLRRKSDCESGRVTRLGKAFLLGTRTGQADIEDSRASPQAAAKFRGQGGEGEGAGQEQVEASQAAAHVLAHLLSASPAGHSVGSWV